MRLLRPQAAAALLGVDKITIWRWSRADATFPRPFRVGKRAIAYDEDELRAWLETRRRAAAA